MSTPMLLCLNFENLSFWTLIGPLWVLGQRYHKGKVGKNEDFF
jgi:hypothetical protein